MVFGWRLAVTLFFVLLNGFFVAAEFALVKVRTTQIASLATAGSARANVAHHILGHLDRYLSACQLGITMASLILGWLAEPAIAELLLAGAAALGFEFAVSGVVLHGIALGLALTVVTVLHMTVGEQAPKIWAIHRSESIALRVAYPLRIFAAVFRPFIWVVNGISNGLLRLVGISPEELSDASIHSAAELKLVLSTSAEAGQITPRQLELAQNVLDIIDLEVRHIMVPRVDVEYLTLQNSPDENLRIIRKSGHSRFPVCTVGLDSVIGIVHAKQVMSEAADGVVPDLRKLARKPLFVSDTQSVSRLIFQLQRSQNHACVVLDEHGTTIGLAFLEDALEEIVGPLHDEFDEEPLLIKRHPSGAIEMSGSVALPEAADLLELGGLDEDADTIGGFVVASLGRLPRVGDELRIGGYRARVVVITRRRIDKLMFEPIDEPDQFQPA
jgi:CBS domain containing-hemolysin-like protein